MMETAEVSHNPVLAGESTGDSSAPPVQRQRRKRQKTGGEWLPLDAKSTDGFVRLALAMSDPPDPGWTPSAEQEQIREKTDPNTPNLDDLFDVHFSASAAFERGDRENPREVLWQIFSHPALGALDTPAKVQASTYIFQARLAYRLKTDGKYWILCGLGEAYPYPLAIRTGAVPCWRRQIRSLEALFEKLRKSASEALRLEADTIVSSRPEQMPAELILSAQIDLRHAIRWMQAFPRPISLRSKYRERTRPDPQTESVAVVAYVLDRLYREHTGESSLKVKEMECLIAELETKFLGQNIHYGPDFGCPAVRLQIRSVKRSKIRSAVDDGLLRTFKMVNRKLEQTARRNDPSKFTAAFDRLLKRMDRHDEGFRAWRDRTESRFNEELRGGLEAATYAGEVREALQEYGRRLRTHIDLGERWIEEYGGHLNALGAPDLEIWDYSKLMRKWMRHWESLWEIFPGEGIRSQKDTVQTGSLILH